MIFVKKLQNAIVNDSDKKWKLKLNQSLQIHNDNGTVCRSGKIHTHPKEGQKKFLGGGGS